jgi:hypothetical protein
LSVCRSGIPSSGHWAAGRSCWQGGAAKAYALLFKQRRAGGGSGGRRRRGHSRSYFFSNSPVRWRLTKVVLPAGEKEE